MARRGGGAQSSSFVRTPKEQFLEHVERNLTTRVDPAELDVTPDTVPYGWAAEELAFDGPCAQGDQGAAVQRIQEWLGLHGAGVKVDSDFGVATVTAVSEFQEAAGLDVTGKVDAETFALLTSPMQRALAPTDPGDRTYGQLVVHYAAQHLAEHPREVGGDNMGPWVRLYMQGHDGSEYPWCAGFASFVLQQAADAMGIDPPIPGSFSCDDLARQGMEAGLFASEDELADGEVEIEPGALFLIRKTDDDWVHTGIVAGCENGSFETIEGNTNDEGSREGYEVCRRIRSADSLDFVLVDYDEE